MEENILILPKSQHYTNITTLRKEILSYEQTRLFEYEKTNSPLNVIPKDKFEKVKISKDRFILIPTAIMYSTLYRGQTDKHPDCLPSLRRINLTDDELFLENLKNTEFELLLNTHPVVSGIFTKNGFVVDNLGLAQHYGLKTNMLDLTLDFDIAMFFATCKLDEKTDKYYPQIESEENQGVLYAYSTIYNLLNENFLSKELGVIGLQPFKRPAVQKGFSLNLSPKKHFNGVEYTFSYTRKDALHYFELFDKGESLWIKDELADRVKLIKNNKYYSLHGLKVAVRRYAPKGKGVSYYQDYLHRNGYTYKKEEDLIWAFSQEDKIRIAEDWDKNENEYFWNSIVRKRMICGGVNFEERDIKSLTNELLLRHVQGGKTIC